MIQAHRIFIKYKDIEVLEGVQKNAALKRMKKIREMFKCKQATIQNYAQFHSQNEDYIIQKMREFKLI